MAVIVLFAMIATVIMVVIKFIDGDPSKVRRWPEWSIPFLATFGSFTAIYLTFIETTQSEAFCGPIGDCNSVQQSPYAILFGFLPVGLLGLLGYLTILALWISQKLDQRRANIAWVGIWALAIFGVLFSIYLTFLEPFVIGATCMWCISSAITITLIMWAATYPALLAMHSDAHS